MSGPSAKKKNQRQLIDADDACLNPGQLLLMMRVYVSCRWEKPGAAHADDACLSLAAGQNLGQLMLMMRAASGKNPGQLMLMMRV